MKLTAAVVAAAFVVTSMPASFRDSPLRGQSLFSALSPVSRINAKPKGAKFKTEFVRAEGKDAKEAVEFHNMTWCVVNDNPGLRLTDEQMEGLIEKGLVYLLKVDGILRGVLCTYRLKTDENLSGIENIPLWDRMKNAEIKDTDPNAVLFWAIGTGYWMEDAPKGINLGETFIKKAKEFFETDEEKKKTKYVGTFSPAGAKRKDKPKITETVKKTAAIFIERARGLFYGGLDRVAGFADMREEGLDAFNKLLEKKGIGDSMRRKYAIYLYLLCFRQGGYEDFFSVVYGNAKDGKGFVSLRDFFKAKLGERIADSVANIHVGKGGASIAKVLPQKAGHTRPDAPYTVIYGYKGFEKDDTAFDDLQKFIEKLVKHGKWPRGSGLISELVKETERQLREEGQISEEPWSKEKIAEITSWFAPYKFEFPDKYLVEAIKACYTQKADSSLGVLMATPEKRLDAETVVSSVVDRCEDEVRVKIFGVDRDAADFAETIRMVIAYSQKSGRQVKIKFIGYDASAENLSHARRSFESLTRSLGEPWANCITYEFHYADFADERYRALIFPEGNQPSTESPFPAASEFVRASNLAPGSRFGAKAYGDRSGIGNGDGSEIDFENVPMPEGIIPPREAKWRAVERALYATKGNMRMAEKLSGIPDSTIYRLLQAHGRKAKDYAKKEEDLELDDLLLGRYFNYLNDTLREIKALAKNKYKDMPTEKLREEARRLKNGPQGDALSERVLIEAFAIFKAAADRLMPDINPNYEELHDEQILTAIAMATGIYTKERTKRWVLAEQASGQGKTLTIAMVAYLWALRGEGVHIGTFNDYLAMRDCMQMGRIYDLLGIKVSVIQADGSNLMYDAQIKPSSLRRYWDTLRRKPLTRRDAYNADIAYGWWASFPHDYLYDSVQSDRAAVFQRGFNAFILDEADDPLADEVRIPLVIAETVKISDGERKKRQDCFYGFKEFASRLTPGKDFVINKRERTIALSEKTLRASGENVNFVINALVARHVLKINVDYIVKEVKKVKRVIVIDRPTGRQLPLHTWDDGLHEAVEAENNLGIRDPSRDVASTNFSDYFNKYKLKSAITATAKPIKDEAWKRYGLYYIPFPLHEPNRRIDLEEVVFRTKEEKWQFVAEATRYMIDPKADVSQLVMEVFQAQVGPRPVLVGTVSIEDSLILSRIFKEKQVGHALLNGLQDTADENKIIKQAGRINPETRKGNATLATNMAGRGTDIIPDETSLENGGLLVIGTEHYESERQDDQLRGRPARQGQLGSFIFITSLEDGVIQRFAQPELLKKIQGDLTHHEGGPIYHVRLKELIATAQLTASDYYRSLRDHTLSCFHIRDIQRTSFYKLRQRLIQGENILESEAALDHLIKDSKAALQDTDIYTYEALADDGLNRKVEALTTRRSLANFAILAKKNLSKWMGDFGERHVIFEMLNLYWMAYAELLEEVEKDTLHKDRMPQKEREEAIDKYREVSLSSWGGFIEGLRQFQIWHKTGLAARPALSDGQAQAGAASEPRQREKTIRSFFERGGYDLMDISKALSLPPQKVRYLIRQDYELRAMQDARLKELIDADETLAQIAVAFGVESINIVRGWITSSDALTRAYRERYKDAASPKTGISVRRGKYRATPEQKGVIQGFFERGIYNWGIISTALSVDEYVLTSFVIRDGVLLEMRNARVRALIDKGENLARIAGVFDKDISTIRDWINFDASLKEAFERAQRTPPPVAAKLSRIAAESIRASNLAPGSRFNVEREKIICGLLGDSVCQEIIDGFAARGLSDAKLAYLENRLSSLQGILWLSYDKLCFDTSVPMFLAELYRLLGYPDRAAEIIDQAIVHAYAELYSNYAMDIPRVFYNSLVSPRNARKQKLLDAINRADPKFIQRFSDEFHASASPEHILTQDIVAKFVYSRVIGDGAYWIRKGIFSPAVEATILDYFPKLEVALSGETRKARLAAVTSLMGRAGVLRQEQDRSAIPGFDRILEWIDAELYGDRSVVIGQDDNELNAYGKRVWNFLLPELMQPEAFTHRDDNARQRWRVNSCFGSYWGQYMESRIQWLVDTLSQQLHRNGTMDVLDLMSGRFSYVPSHIKCHALALGMNAEELAKNETADAVIVQDLVENPTLALDSNSQDMVIVVSGIQYIDPREVLKEAKRVLRPGGMLLIIGAWNATITERQIQGWDGSVGFIAGLMKRAGFDEIFYHVGLVFQTESHPLWPYAVWSLKEQESDLDRFEALAAQTIRASN